MYPFCEVVYKKWYILSRHLPYWQDSEQILAPKHNTNLDKEQIFNELPLAKRAIPLVLVVLGMNPSKLSGKDSV